MAWYAEREAMREINAQSSGEVNGLDHSAGMMHLFSKFVFFTQASHSKDQRACLSRLEAFTLHMQQSPAFCLIYNHLRSSIDWAYLVAEDGNESLPRERQVAAFGKSSSPFPIDLFLSSIDGIHDSLLHTLLTCERADYTAYDMEHFTGDQYRDEWRRNLDETIMMVRELIATGKEDWGEPPNLENLGMTLNFVPHTRLGILSLFPPHKPHLLPPESITRYTIVPTIRTITRGRGARTRITLEYGTGNNPQHEIPRVHFVVTPPGFFTPFHHNIPVGYYSYNLCGWSIWLAFPATAQNLQAWYSTIDSNRYQYPQWAFRFLKGLTVCITGPGERFLVRPAYFHACFSLTPVVQAAQEYITHHDLPYILCLQKDCLRRMHSLPAGHQYEDLGSTIRAWSVGMEDQFLRHFRHRWREQYDLALTQMEEEIRAEEDSDDGDEDFILDDSEF